MIKYMNKEKTRKLYQIAFLSIVMLLVCLLCGCQSQQAVTWQLENQEADIQNEVGTDSTENEIAETIAEETPKIYVYLCGAVHQPKVYEVEEGCRLFEAIEMAGGFTEDADANSLNLARVLQDGEQVQILTKEETQKLQENGGVVNAGSTQQSQTGLVNINTATKEQLTTLSGIGEGRAEAIMQYRKEHGSFQKIEQIMEVSGIKNALYDKIKDKITV